MSAKSVRTSEPSTAAPVVAIFQIAATDELLFSRVQPLVSLPVVLASECLAADAAYEGALISVGA